MFHLCSGMKDTIRLSTTRMYLLLPSVRHEGHLQGTGHVHQLQWRCLFSAVLADNACIEDIMKLYSISAKKMEAIASYDTSKFS